MNYRYERKFFIRDLSLEKVIKIIKLHPAVFSEIYPPRVINNIYYDSFNYNNYTQNMNGVQNRNKVRIRWYGSSSGLISHPNLEIKIRHGLLGSKTRYSIEPFNIDYPLIDLKSNVPSDELSRFDLISLEQKLFNCYYRYYYLSSDKKFRVTIDCNQFFRKIQFNKINSHKYSDNNSIIVELKYDKCYDSIVNNISSLFPFPLTKSSKYVNGVKRIIQH